MNREDALGSSFRDPSGFVFERDGVLYRQVDGRYAGDYDQLISSGLYQELVDQNLLVPHEEVDVAGAPAEGAHRLLRPERVPFVSYPYEWCFSQLKDAAMTTLRIQRTALRFGMTLKDASAYNIQFRRGRPVHIDTLSFERHDEGSWVAYRQFCEHFLAPLALVALCDARLAQLLRVQIDGIPLDLAVSLLPWRAWTRLQLLLHLRLHARYQRRYANTPGAITKKARTLGRDSLDNLVAGLERACRGLSWKPEATDWSDYYEEDGYSAPATDHKRVLVAGHLDVLRPSEVWDLGANTGLYSRLASERGVRTVAFDLDAACTERCYRDLRENDRGDLLPLVVDLSNPSPALGWAHQERASLAQRSSADVVLALALVHHLAITHNVPLERIAVFFAGLASGLIVEFVPKSDPNCQRLLAGRADVFDDYSQEGFEQAFGRYYQIEDATPIRDSERMLYRMRRRAESRPD